MIAGSQSSVTVIAITARTSGLMTWCVNASLSALVGKFGAALLPVSCVIGKVC